MDNYSNVTVTDILTIIYSDIILNVHYLRRDDRFTHSHPNLEPLQVLIDNASFPKHQYCYIKGNIATAEACSSASSLAALL